MIKMNDFEQGLANIMGSFMEVNLDCVEKQNQEIEQLQNNWNELKKWLEEEIKEIDLYIGDLDIYNSWDYDTINDMSSKAIAYKEVLKKMQELEQGKDDTNIL